MESWLAGIFAIASLTDMALNDCPDGCLTTSDATARLAFRGGEVFFQGEPIAEEIYLELDAGYRYGPFQPAVSLAYSSQNSIWAGAGFKWTSENHWPGPLFVEGSFMPGLYFANDGPDIGGLVQFRGALGLAMPLTTGRRCPW